MSVGMVRSHIAYLMAGLLTIAAAQAYGSAARFKIVPPDSSLWSTTGFDLGVRDVRVTAIDVSAAGEARSGDHKRVCPGGATTACDDPIRIARGFSITVSDDGSLGSPSVSGAWGPLPDGAFAVGEVLPAGESGFLADGRGVFLLRDDGAVDDSMFLHSCEMQRCSCAECVPGKLSFTSPIFVLISYETMVPAEARSWGRVKAVYR